jgi:formylglycine-generating enzyme required for sulfatase activity
MIRLRIVAVVALLVLFAPIARAEHRVALVIGNSAYPGAELASPAEDVKTVRAALEARGFTVGTIENADLKTMEDGIERFVHSVPTRGTALVYFSGYALRGGQGAYADNFLLPIDANVVNTASVQQAKIGVRWLLERLRTFSGSERNIVLVDGCYAHPKQNKTQDYKLAPVPKFPEESLAIYAAPLGTVVEPPKSGPSALALQLRDELASRKSLADVLKSLGDAEAPNVVRESTLENLDGLADSPSRAIGPAIPVKPGLKAGDEWVNPWGMVFCWCPSGTFTMGSPPTELGHDEEEIQKGVTIVKGFWIAKYEFTRREIMTLMKSHTYLSTGTHKLQPLDKMRKDNVGQWLAILNGDVAAGWRYAVPTEEEWEYAARAGSTTAYHFGDDMRELSRFANFADVSLYDTEGGYYAYADQSLSDGSAPIAKVGSYRPNAWGLHDVCGNLAEHCDTPYTSPKIKPGNYPNHVIRGGSWLSMPTSCRSAARNYFSFGASENVVPNHVGYRLVIRQQ